MSVAAREQRSDRSVKVRVVGTFALLAGWVALYAGLRPASEWAVRQLPIDPASALGQALEFFIYDTPKVLLLLTLVVFAMGVVRSFFSPEHTWRAGAKGSVISRRPDWAC